MKLIGAELLLPYNEIRNEATKTKIVWFYVCQMHCVRSRIYSKSAFNCRQRYSKGIWCKFRRRVSIWTSRGIIGEFASLGDSWQCLREYQCLSCWQWTAFIDATPSVGPSKYVVRFEVRSRKIQPTRSLLVQSETIEIVSRPQKLTT